MNKFIIVRHGQTEWNILGKTQGHGDSPLTEKGIEQAENLARALDAYDIDLIYSSDSLRAYNTAKKVAERKNLDIIATESLREMGFGEWEGKLISEITTDYADIYKTWRNEPLKANIPGGETLYDIKERVDGLIDEINSKYDGKTILLLTHSIALRVMLLSFLNSGLENIYRIKQDNTAINIVEYRDYGPVIIKVNDTSHVHEDTKTNNSALE